MPLSAFRPEPFPKIPKKLQSAAVNQVRSIRISVCLRPNPSPVAHPRRTQRPPHYCAIHAALPVRPLELRLQT
jgi:hypothetical protein